MRVTFVIVSVSDRVDALNNLIDTIMQDRRFDSYDICLMFQDPGKVASRIKNRFRFRKIIINGQLLGCHGARVILLREIEELKYDAYVNLDDDMELCEHTDYEPAIWKAMQKGVGFVMTNWARTPELLQKKLPVTKKFIPQIMLYNGGGMAYSENVAALIRQLEPVKTAFDCAWPITAYVNGLVNYRYQGSLAVHRVCTTGGMSVFMKNTPLHVMCEEWLEFHPTKKQDGSCKSVHIPLDKQVKPAAKALHNSRRKLLFGER